LAGDATRVVEDVGHLLEEAREVSHVPAGEAREEESTAIQWTLWGKQAENAAEYSRIPWP